MAPSTSADAATVPAPGDADVDSSPRAGDAPASFWLTRFCVLRLLGVIYLVAFLVAAFQILPLIGHDGLLPADAFLGRVAEAYGSRLAGFERLPSLFWLDVSDATLVGAAWTGVALSLLVVVGFANALLMATLWALYMSFVHVGQDWYGYGWEIQLLETGFLAIFLCPLFDPRPFPRRPPPVAVVWLLRWLIARIMLGAGLIKLRGDSCWRDLTCLYWHYETQPLPNPLSRTLHFMPHWFHRAGVAFNHVTELVAPWGLLGPRVVRHAAGVVLVGFQLFLIASGNLSFLNWLTLVPALACFDDRPLRRVLPRALVARAAGAAAIARRSRLDTPVTAALVVLVGALSVNPVRNLLSSHQTMNGAFDRLSLVNTYGAFGTVGRVRPEIVFEGTRDAALTDATEWTPYEFPCKPGDPQRRPCIVAPYQYRLDWQIWFAAMSTPERYPWTVHLAWKLLHNDPGALSLLATNPFPDAPPRFVRARYYRYEFAPRDAPGGAWWTRTLVRDWFPPLAVDDPRLRAFLRAHGWAAEP